MSITVREKEHWKERIARKIERAVEQLVEVNDAKYLKRIAEAARQQAIVALGGRELLERRSQLKAEEARLKGELEQSSRELVAAAQGTSVDESRYVYDADDVWQRAVAKRGLCIV